MNHEPKGNQQGRVVKPRKLGWTTVDFSLLQQERYQDLGAKTDSMDGVDDKPCQDTGCSFISWDTAGSLPVAVTVVDIFYMSQTGHQAPGNKL